MTVKPITGFKVNGETQPVSYPHLHGKTAVEYVEQALSEKDKQQARLNIDVFSKQETKDIALLVASDVNNLPVDWPTLARLVKTGGAKSVLSVGDLIEESWTDKSVTEPKEYSLPWGVRHFGQVELADGTTADGLYLETHYAHVKGVQFSHQRAFLKCPEGLSAGTYYFTIESKWGSNVLAGDVVCFTLTQDVPAGGRVSGCYGAPDQTKDKWRIYTHSADGKTILETIVPAFEVAEGAVDLGIQKYSSRNGNLNSCQEMAYGWNRWSTSAMRQYLNSAADKGVWWTPQDEFDIAPDQLTQIPGFLSGLPQEMIDSMLPVKTRTYLNTANDTTEYGVAYDDTYDKVFLPSLNQMYVTADFTDEGETWDYWKLLSDGDKFKVYPATYPQVIHYATENRTSPQTVRLRSAGRWAAHYAWCVHSAGSFASDGASNAMRPVPACVIGLI